METKFEKLYYLENIESDKFTKEMENNFIFCGRNWGFYFISKFSNECEELKKVELIEWDFSKKDPNWIDYDSELNLNLIYS